MKELFLCIGLAFFLNPEVTPQISIEDFRYNMSMSELDDLIIKNIQYPEKGQGEELVKNSFTYYDILDDAKNMVDEGNPKGQRIVDEIGPEGPKWVKVKYDEYLLRCTYNWKRSDMTHFVATIDATIELWESFFENITTTETYYGE